MIPRLSCSQGSHMTSLWPVRYKYKGQVRLVGIIPKIKRRALIFPFCTQECSLMTGAQQPFCSMRLRAPWTVLQPPCPSWTPHLDFLCMKKVYLCLLKARVLLNFLITAIKPKANPGDIQETGLESFRKLLERLGK